MTHFKLGKNDVIFRHHVTSMGQRKIPVGDSDFSLFQARDMMNITFFSS